MPPAGSLGTVKIPLFPLHAVLFPCTTLSLHVFEPRYREMVGRCLEHEESFGTCLILEGEEVGGTAIPHHVGTEAAIIAAQRFGDGRYEIVVEGRRRFEVLALDRSRRYLQAEVRLLPEDMEGDLGLARGVAKLVEPVLESAELAGAAIVDETWKELDPRSLSYRVASALPVAEGAKQGLLEIPDVDSRLRREAELLIAVGGIGARAGAS